MNAMEGTLSIAVAVGVTAVLALDLGVFHRKEHALSIKSAVGWSVFWIGFALLFNVIIYFTLGKESAVLFLSGYLVEKSLSVDNLFVFLLIFSYFQVPERLQHKVLFWGIVGAVVMRGVLIWAGIQLIETYHWLIYLLGAFLIVTGVRTLKKHDDSIDVEHRPVLRLLRRYLPITEGYVGGRFIVRRQKKWFVTPLFVVLVMIETTDVLFALDSIPAILGITTDPFLLYTSNLFAILGLRALYFVLAGLMQKFALLSYGVSFILIFVGATMLISPWYVVSEGMTLAFILTILAVSAGLSLWLPQKGAEPEAVRDQPAAGGISAKDA